MILLASALGQIGLPGGGFGFGYGSARRHRRSAAVVSPRRRWTASRIRSTSRSRRRASPTACSIPASAYDFNGKRGTYPDIKLVYWAGGNPFHHHQDINKLRRAWQRPETIVVHEPWWTATARHADIVLPATTSLERNDIGGARARHVHHGDAAGDRAGRRGAQRLRHLQRSGGAARRAEAYTQGRDEMAWLRHLYERCRHSAGTNAGGAAGLRHVLARRLSGNPAARRGIRACSATSAPIRNKHKLAHAVRPDRALLREDRGLRLRRLPAASDLDRAVRNGSAARTAKTYPLHLVSSQPRDRLHSQMDCGPGQRRAARSRAARRS